MNLTGARITQQGDLTYSTPFPRVVSACRHYWCPFGVHNDASGLLRRALVRRVVPLIPGAASSGAFRVVRSTCRRQKSFYNVLYGNLASTPPSMTKVRPLTNADRSLKR